MDKLERFIADNRESFNQEALPSGHVERFEAKLAVVAKPAGRRYLRSIWYAAGVAATVLVLLLAGYPMLKGEGGGASEFCPASAEINSLRTYYLMQMNDVIARIEDAETGNGLEKQQLLEESQRIMEANKRFEKSLLRRLPGSQETAYALIQLYGTSLNSLNFMLEQIESRNESYQPLK